MERILRTKHSYMIKISMSLCPRFPSIKTSSVRVFVIITGGELRNGVNGFLTSYATDSVRFSTIFATDSWQRTRGHDECVHKMTNVIDDYRFVKPYIIHNIA